ncbi:MAG: flagellar basal body rod protein FlgB [Nitrospinota bacterium]
MPVISLSTNTMKAVAQSLDLRLRRHRMLISNLANMSTPGYRAVDLDFEENLKRAMGRGSVPALRKTNPRHMGLAGSLDEQVEGKVIASPTPGGRGDGNSVDIDYQMSRLLQNQLLYSAGVQALRRMFRGLQYAITQAGAGR